MNVKSTREPHILIICLLCRMNVWDLAVAEGEAVIHQLGRVAVSLQSINVRYSTLHMNILQASWERIWRAKEKRKKK